MAMFLTDLLFSSLQLRFSEQQKAAVLNWGKKLGARDVLSASAVKKCQERIKMLVENPIEKVESNSGTVFYINDIGTAIAKDYANPLTRSLMQDYLIDSEGGMLQVFHVEKMLLGMPSELAAPMVCVDGEIYFINELLQLDSYEYFIPEHFFASYSSISNSDTSGPFCTTQELFTLGRTVTRSDMGFIVVDECVIVPILTFQCTFEEICAMIRPRGPWYLGSAPQRGWG
ncbi:hypothetical protein AcW1_002444 [Taiwanofungus camphoratus]|nr:hypothetical protein AcW1_002444 [Antrodia cinnamomea]